MIRKMVSKVSEYPYKERIPNSLFLNNRTRVINKFKAALKDSLPARSIALFRGQSEVPIYNSDVSYPDYQEGNFYYLYGVNQMDCYGVLDFQSEKGLLFVPRLDNMYKIWMSVKSKEDYESTYEIETHYLDELQQWLKDNETQRVYINSGVNTDSGLENFVPADQYIVGQDVDREVLFPILSNTRAVKSEEEIDVLRWATQITVEGHVEVLRHCKAGLRESQLATVFYNYCSYNYLCGRVQPYNPIVCCGPTAATLHYNDNDKYLEEGQTMLIDQGHGVHHYISDITSSFPVNGKFTKKQAEIYSLVLKANRAVHDQLKPGVSWPDMHLLAERVILTGLRDLGLISGDIEEMLEGRLGYIFQPHGLGHLYGLEVHDVGGYIKGVTPERSTLPGLRNLRTARTLEKGLAITVEPGIYFRDFLLNGEFDQSSLKIDLKYLNREKIAEYQQEISGVRIEDCVVITEDGSENLSKDLPRTVEEIEACMRGEEWRL